MLFTFPTPALAQISVGFDSGSVPNTICITGEYLTLGPDDDKCQTATQQLPYLLIGSSTNDHVLLDGSTGEATFNAPAYFNDPTTFSDTVSFSGANVTFATPTTFTFSSTFQAATTFNGTTDFTAGVTTANITNSGTINSTNVNVTGSLTAGPNTTINFGGVNRLQGVAAGINALDAVNVAQLNAATSGITTNITTLQNTVAAQGTEITTIQTINATQSGQINALQASQEMFEGAVDTLFDLRSRDRRDMKQGVAAAMAMASAPMPSEPGRIAYAVNGATFRGEYAMGGSLTYRLNTRSPMAVNVGFSYAGNKNNGARVGVAGEF
jgi:hypothetical protein